MIIFLIFRMQINTYVIFNYRKVTLGILGLSRVMGNASLDWLISIEQTFLNLDKEILFLLNYRKIISNKIIFKIIPNIFKNTFNSFNINCNRVDNENKNGRNVK